MFSTEGHLFPILSELRQETWLSADTNKLHTGPTKTDQSPLTHQQQQRIVVDARINNSSINVSVETYGWLCLRVISHNTSGYAHNISKSFYFSRPELVLIG